jgi:hypothetical protein
MCAAWNRPELGYPELERLRLAMKVDAPVLYRAVVAVLYPRFVRRAVCPKCLVVKPPELVGELHRHNGRGTSPFVARMLRVPLFPVSDRSVDDAISWLDEHWAGGVYIPDELLPLVSTA